MSPVLEPLLVELTSYLRKANRQLRQASLAALEVTYMLAHAACTTCSAVTTKRCTLEQALHCPATGAFSLTSTWALSKWSATKSVLLVGRPT